MERGYLRGGLYAAIAMGVVILWSFGSLAHLLLATLPLVVGGAWTLGIMDLFQVNFNLANLIILPLIAGYGIMNGLHIVKRYQQQGGKGPIVANSTGRAGRGPSSPTAPVGRSSSLPPPPWWALGA
jgi:predicted RND superfamily exporter protein